MICQPVSQKESQKMSQKIVLTLLFLFSSLAHAADLTQAEAMAASGDLDGALNSYMEALGEDPGNVATLEAAANVASKLQITEMAADFLVQAVGSAVADGDRATAERLNQRISELYSQMPAWVDEKRAAAAAFEDFQADALVAMDEMAAEAEQLFLIGDFEGSVAAQESALLIGSDVLGAEHGAVIQANKSLGMIYLQLGMAQEAEQYLRISADSSAAVLGEGHPDTLETQTLLAELYGAVGMVDESTGMNLSIIASYADALGDNHPLTIEAQFGFVNTLEVWTQLDDAFGFAGGLCSALETSYGPYHPQSVRCLQVTGGILNAAGELAQAEQTYDQVVERLGASQTDIDVNVIGALFKLAELYRVLGRYDESKDLLSGLIHTTLSMGDIAATYTGKSYLARVLNNQGDYQKAEDLTQEVLDYGLQNWTETQPVSIYNTLLELGSIYQAQSKLADAEATYEEALQGLVELLGEGHPSSMVARGNLGQIYEMMGLFDQAEPLLKDTLALMESILGEAHADTLSVRNNLALLYESQGNFREAEPLYEKSRTLMIELFGEDHNNPTAVANNLAYLYMLMEEYEKSTGMFEEVIRRWEGIFGPEHQNTLKARNNLGRVYKRQGILDLAEQNISTALELRRSVLGADHIDAIRSMIDLGGVYIDQGRNEEAVTLLTDALALAETELGNLHPYTFDALNYLADVNENMNELQSAVELRELGFARRSDFLDTMLWTTGENAREGYVRLHRPEFNAYLALLSRIGDERSAQRLIDASLQRKGLLLKVTSEIQQIATMTTDPELSALANELEQARVELASKTLSGPTAETKDNHVQILYELEQRVNEIQGEIGRASVRFRTSIAGSSSDRLTGEMAEDSALVDFLAYEQDGEPKLLAGVITKFGDEVTYHIVNYDNRPEMEEYIGMYREMIQDDLVDEDELAEIGIETYLTVWEPLMDTLEDLDYVYLIPDGLLNIVPFGALMNEDEEYLIQTHDLHMLTSGRDLLPNEFDLAVGEYLVMAGPDYDSDKVVSADVMEAAAGRRSAALQMGIRGAGSGLRGLNFAPLPGAEEEGKIIIDRVVSNDGASENFFGNEAQEQILVDMNAAPEILHVATHGFFLKPDEGLRKRLLKAMRGTEVHVPPPGDNPMLRAGLAFAGINTNAQFLGDIETTNDGVLTALEVLDLNLSGTKLVVLSACETGLGEIHEGEGVYGLRRSFQEAGVAEVVSSLWEVSDAGTQALMTDFYDKMLNGQPAREALRETQLEMIEDPQWGYPYIWSAFMIVGSYESAGFAVN